MPKSIIPTLRRHAKEVLKLEDATAKDFLGILKQTEMEIVGRLSNVASPETPFSASMLNQVLGEVKVAINALTNKAQGFYTGAQAEAADLAVEQTIGEIARMSSAIDGVSLNLSLSAASGLSDPAQALLANHFETSVQRYGIDVLQSVRQRIQLGMITGEPVKGVVSDVQKAINGTKWKAEQIVRTETSHAYGASKHRSIVDSAKQVPGLKKVWIHIGSYPCPVCIKLDGTERPLDGTWTITIGKKTKKVAHPPGHPSCVCALAAMKPSWRDKLKKLGYLEDNEE